MRFFTFSLVRISEEEKKAAAEKRQFNSLCQLYRKIGNGLALNEVEGSFHVRKAIELGKNTQAASSLQQ